ncbi:MAG: ATP synthase F0 subunit B [Polyangiaceae bacterium]|nr:ATP synthase F0 subunit B [Polyangiaceae bacterium]
MTRNLGTPLLLAGGVNVDFDLTFLAHFVLFAAFIFLMKPIIFDPLLRLFEERERRTAGAIARARGMDEQAIVLKQSYDEKLEGVRRVAAVDREAERSRLNALQNELMAATRHAVDERLRASSIKLEIEVSDARRELERDESVVAAQIASRVLGREVRP